MPTESPIVQNPITKEYLTTQIDLVNKERDQAIMNVSRCDGALFILKAMIESMDQKPETVAAPTQESNPST